MGNIDARMEYTLDFIFCANMILQTCPPYHRESLSGFCFKHETTLWNCLWFFWPCLIDLATFIQLGKVTMRIRTLIYNQGFLYIWRKMTVETVMEGWEETRNRRLSGLWWELKRKRELRERTYLSQRLSFSSLSSLLILWKCQFLKAK